MHIVYLITYVAMVGSMGIFFSTVMKKSSAASSVTILMVFVMSIGIWLGIGIIMAIFASFLVAEIVVPFLLKQVLSDKGPKIRKNERRFDKVMKKIERGYRKFLGIAIENRLTVIIAAILLLVFSAFTAFRLGIAFIPSTDNSDFYISMDLPVGTTLEQTREKMDVAQ